MGGLAKEGDGRELEGMGEEAMTYRDDDPDWNQDCGRSMADRR